MTDQHRELAERYRRLANIKPFGYLDKAEAKSVALVAICQAAQSWEGRGNFALYAKIAIHRHLREANQTCVRIPRSAEKCYPEDADRAHKPMSYEVLDLTSSRELSPPDEACRREWHDRFWKAVSSMSDKEREIVHRMVDGQGLLETARATSIKRRTLRAKIDLIMPMIARAVGWNIAEKEGTL